MDFPNSNRDTLGRFTPGGPGGPGRPRGRVNLMQHAAEDAVAPEHIAAIIRRATRMALEGNLAAMRLVLDRVCGKTADARVEGSPIDVSMPDLRTAANCTLAIDKVMDAITTGTVDLPTAKFLLDAVERRRKAIETLEHEARLTELEEAASHVDFGKR